MNDITAVEGELDGFGNPQRSSCSAPSRNLGQFSKRKMEKQQRDA